MWSQITNVTDRRQTDDMRSQDRALHLSAFRCKNADTIRYTIPILSVSPIYRDNFNFFIISTRLLTEALSVTNIIIYIIRLARHASVWENETVAASACLSRVTFKNRLDKFWCDQEVFYDYNTDLHGIGNRSLLLTVVLCNKYLWFYVYFSDTEAS